MLFGVSIIIWMFCTFVFLFFWVYSVMCYCSKTGYIYKESLVSTFGTKLTSPDFINKRTQEVRFQILNIVTAVDVAFKVYFISSCFPWNHPITLASLVPWCTIWATGSCWDLFFLLFNRTNETSDMEQEIWSALSLLLFIIVRTLINMLLTLWRWY